MHHLMLYACRFLEPQHPLLSVGSTVQILGEVNPATDARTGLTVVDAHILRDFSDADLDLYMKSVVIIQKEIKAFKTATLQE